MILQTVRDVSMFNNQESTINKIRELWKNKLEITDAETIQVQRCHRFGPQIANRPRDIIVRFALFPDRDHDVVVMYNRVWSVDEK